MRKAALTSILTVFLAILIVALLLAPALAATAGFVKTDTTTMGSWIGAYGADGYFVSQDSNTKLPGYAKVTFSGQANWTWACFHDCFACLAEAREREQPHCRNLVYVGQFHNRCELDR